MKYKSKKKQHSVKKSSGGQSKELLKTLQKIIVEQTGTVSYYFVDERMENIHSNDIKKMTQREEKAILHVNLTKQAIEKKTPNDLIHMFETTKSDLGAKYFVVA